MPPFGNALGNSIVTKLSQPKGYQVGDEITTDGQKGYVAGVDENGQPTSISHSADNLRVERAQLEQWRVDDISFAMKAARQRGLAGWSYDSGQSGLINESLIGRILSDEMHKMHQGLLNNGQNQQGNSSTKQQMASSASAMTGWLDDASKTSQYLSNGLLGLQGLANQGFGVGLMAQSNPGGASSMMRQLGLGQYSPFALSFDGSSLTHANNSTHYFGFGNTANMTRGFGVAELLDKQFMHAAEPVLKWGGPLVSLGQAIDFTFVQNDGLGHTWSMPEHRGSLISHWGKVGADFGFAIAAGIPGAAYSVTDLALSLTPKYQIRFGQHSGQRVDGWEKAGFYTLDKVQGITNNTIDFQFGRRGLDVLIKPFPSQIPPRKN